MIFETVKNEIQNIVGGINDGLKLSEYARIATELRKLSDKELAEQGISKELLEKGVNAYPWTNEIISKGTTNNVAKLKVTKKMSIKSIFSQRSKAA